MWSPNIWVLLSVFSTVVTFSISYPLAFANHDIEDQDFTLSSSIAYPPESMIGSLGLSISAVCQWVLLYLRYRFIDMKDPEIHRVNYYTYLLGFVSALGCMGVGAFQSSNGIVIHLCCAYLNFVGFNIYLLIHTWYIDPRLEKADPQYQRGLLRCIISITGPVCFLLMFIIHTKLAFSVLEIILIAGFLLWMLTLYGSFGDTKFEIVTKSSGEFEERLLNKIQPFREDGLLIQDDGSPSKQ